MRGRTLIVIAHRLSTIVDADQIAVVNDGRIEAAGNTDGASSNLSAVQEALERIPRPATAWRMEETAMLEILKKFFRFCNERERREFYVSIVLGVIAALLSALKLPAIAVCLQAILTGGTTSKLSSFH